ncbi:sulfotransferase 1E1-like isoform X2 [Oculina patagonica]
MASSPVFQVTEGEWTSERFIDVLGVKMPVGFTPDPQLLCDFISNFQTRPDDVFVATYPKSGTTWVQEIVWQIFNEGQVKSSHIMERVPFFDFATNTVFPRVDFDTLPSPRILKTHLPYHTIPKSANEDTKCKYIYVARNPKDVAVSFYKMVTSLKSLGNGYHGPWEFYAKLFIEGNVVYNLWNDHVLGWWKHKDDPNVLFVKYEDLKKDLPSNVRMIANFLNKPLSDDLISRIAEQCTFSGMKKNPASFAVPIGPDGDETSLLRKGVVGDWKNYFTPELNERFEKEVLAKLKESGLEFDFEI